MNILHILPELEEGGVERHVLDLTRGLAERGHRVGVLSAGGPLAERLDSRVEHYVLPVHRKNLCTGLYAAFALARLVRREGWQVLHAHSRVPFWIAWWASSLTGVPWAGTAHALYSLNPGIFPLRRARRVICVSQAVQKHLEGHLPPQDRVSVIYNGLFSRKELGDMASSRKGPEFSEPPELLFVGRLTRLKGLEMLFDALEKLDCYGWTLRIVGDGPLREELVLRAKRLGWGSRVFFEGYAEDVTPFMKRASALVFPSLEEGMGRVFLEAAALGLPIFASRLPALEEMVEGEKLLPPGDAKAWEQALKAYVAGEQQPPRFDPKTLPVLEDMISAHEELYRKILG